MQPARTESRLQSLESLRGLAAFVVLLTHIQFAFWYGQPDPVAPPLFGLWNNGKFAVRVFFVLSGFVLSRSYFTTSDIAVVRSSAARRYFRLAVPAGTSVIISYLLFVSGAIANHKLADQVDGAPNPWLHSLYVAPISITSALREAVFDACFDFKYGTSLNVNLWTMEVELEGSFLIFAILALFGTARHRWLIYAVSAFVADRLQATYMIDFIVGVALCDWLSRNETASRYRPGVWIICLVGLCLGDLRSAWVETLGVPLLLRGMRFWQTAGAVLCVAGIIRSKSLSSALTIKPLVELGSISFYLYLFHLPVICSLGAYLYCVFRETGHGHNFSALVASAACIVTSFSAGKAGVVFIDPLALNVGRWFSNALFPKDGSINKPVEVQQSLQG
jgi:peptidoglycan/LPS O-acetylase OafA/YrhL